MKIFSKLFGKKTPSSSTSTVANYPSEHHRKNEQNESAMIGNVKILLYLNRKTVELIRSEGIEWPDAVCCFMVRNFGSLSELDVSHDRVTLSPVSKVRCQTTPIYHDRQGGIYVLFEELDNEIKEKEELEFLGMIDPQRYAGALCARFGITGKSVYI